jgi:hypothetical protein
MAAVCHRRHKKEFVAADVRRLHSTGQWVKFVFRRDMKF